MLKRITNNLWLKIISAFFATVLWLVVVNIDDPTITRAFYNIDVTVLNENVITDQGKVHEVIDNTDTISIVVEAKRSVLDQLDASNFKAVADMDNIIMSQEQLVPIQVSATRNNGDITITHQSAYNMKVNIEALSTKQFELSTTTIGDPIEGYALGTVFVFPSVMKVSGPESIVSKIEKVVVEVDVSGMKSSNEKSVKPKLYDKEGEKIESSRLSYDNEKIAVSVEILETKSLSLNFDIKGEVEEGYRYMGLEYQPQSIIVKGSKDVLQTIDSISISSDELSLEGATGNIEITVDDVSQYLPKGVQLINQDKASIAVKLLVEPLATKTYKIPLTNIKIQNLANSFNMEYTSNESVEITVQGLGTDLDSLTLDSIVANLDLENKQAGTRMVTLDIVLPDGFSLVGNARVKVKIIKEEETTTAEGLVDNLNNNENEQDSTIDRDENSNSNDDNADPNDTALDDTGVDDMDSNNNE